MKNKELLAFENVLFECPLSQNRFLGGTLFCQLSQRESQESLSLWERCLFEEKAERVNGRVSLTNSLFFILLCKHCGGEIAVAGIRQQYHDGLARIFLAFCKLSGCV